MGEQDTAGAHFEKEGRPIRVGPLFVYMNYSGPGGGVPGAGGMRLRGGTSTGTPRTPRVTSRKQAAAASQNRATYCPDRSV